MKKLSLDRLRVESFGTSPGVPAARGTVMARENTTNCPDTPYGTCYYSCFETCPGCTLAIDCY